MAIGVFIAPILLCWEALSAAEPKNASTSPGSRRALTHPAITAAFPIRGADEKPILIHFQHLVAVGGAYGDTTERVAEIGIEQRVTLHGPPARESRYGYTVERDLSMERTVGTKRIPAALRLICINPFSDECSSALPIESGAAGNNRYEYQRQRGFDE